MVGYHAIILHAHLPFVRHPEHERFLEESWLFEAITECYLPLLEIMQGWERDGVPWALTISISPTLATMLRDPLLQARYYRRLNGLIELAEKEITRTHFERPLQELAKMYHKRWCGLRETWVACGRDIPGALANFQKTGRLELITCSATHAVLPLLNHEPSIRAQVFVARDEHSRNFGAAPPGFWLPECAYKPGLEMTLGEAGLRWFVVEAHGLLCATPRPRFGVYAPVFTNAGVAAFGRDLESARQVWSRHEGYPGDFNYRDFYRDIGFDLDFEYLQPYLPSPGLRGYTGLKYYRITGPGRHKEPYNRQAALQTARAHAQHFLEARLAQTERLAGVMERPPIVVSPFDAELFGHWWYEGPEFLDYYVRAAAGYRKKLELITPTEYLRRHPTQQMATPAASSWGEQGYFKLWLNETNQWIFPHLQAAQKRMTELAVQFGNAGGLMERALRQAGRELLLAQASDWPFIMRTNTSPDYARRRVTDHLSRFNHLFEQLKQGRVDEGWLQDVESRDNLFAGLRTEYWR